MRLIVIGLSWLLLVGVGGGQEETRSVQSKGETIVARNLETLQQIKSVLQEVERELAVARERQEAAANEEERNVQAAEITSLVTRLKTLQTDFRKVALGLEEADYDSVEESVFDVGSEVQGVLKPVFRELNDATTGLRELDELRTNREVARDRQRMASGAIERLAGLIGETGDDVELRTTLEEMRNSWEGRAAQAASQAQSWQLQIEEREQQKVSFVDRVSQGFNLFCQTRGKNLLFALVALVGVYLFLRWAYRFVRKISPWHRKPSSFFARLVDIAYALFSGLAGIGAAFAVLFLTGDWVLLVLGMLFLGGVLWTSKNTLPHIYEQTKILLNLGSVREKERLVYEGIPWEVRSLGLYCDFKNPELSGGQLRLPLRTLVGLHSRQSDGKEPWFPTSLHDWVRMPDGVLGKVVVQTPEQVELVKLGGSRVFYRASSFLEMAPENLSKNFRISVVFGIDYAHQATSTEEIPQLFFAQLNKVLLGEVGADGLMNLRVEFKQAAASSLDYEVLADFSGELASRYNTLQRMISRVCVEVCNEQGYVIPFTQVTIHQAQP